MTILTPEGSVTGDTEARRTTALFIDFDNLFGELLSLDRAAARSFAESPQVWLERLCSFGLHNAHRDVLVRRIYLNPAGSVADPGKAKDKGRILFQNFRPFLTQAGFEVIDCPALTRQSKNAADIRIVIDVLDAMNSETRYDEFIIGSSDSDFTPLLQRLRAADRRTVIMSTTAMSPAYRNIAHVVLDAEDVIELTTGLSSVSGGTAQVAAAGEPGDSVRQNGSNANEAAVEDLATRKWAAKYIASVIHSSDEPVLLGQLGQSIRAELDRRGKEVHKWFGFNTLGRFVQSLNDGQFQASGQYAWEPGRHAEPPAPEPATEGQSDMGSVSKPESDTEVEMPDVMVKLKAVAGLPLLTSKTWSALLRKLIEYSRGHEFKLSEATAWVRDELADGPFPISRSNVGFVTRSVQLGGASLAAEECPSLEQCVEAVIASSSDRAAAAGWTLDETELATFREWISAASSFVGGTVAA